MPDQWTKLTIVVVDDVAALFELARERVIEFATHDPKDAIQNGLILEALLADFLAGPDPRGQRHA